MQRSENNDHFKMTSYNSIKKWAIEAKELLAKGEFGSVKVNLTMIQNQADEEIKRLKKDT
jgi:hypothetical protein